MEVHDHEWVYHPAADQCIISAGWGEKDGSRFWRQGFSENLKKVEKKDATATEEGNSTYWFCDKCNKYFSDAKAETEIKKEDTVLAKLSTVNKKETEASSAKTANATKVTSTTDKTTKSSPKTGDSTDVQLYVILMLVSIGAAAGAGAKRKLKTQR